MVLTVLWDLAGAPLQQQADSPPSGLDQLDGSGVGHVLGALAVDLDDLIPDLEVCDGDERRKRYTFRILLARNHPAVAGLVQLETRFQWRPQKEGTRTESLLIGRDR